MHICFFISLMDMDNISLLRGYIFIYELFLMKILICILFYIFLNNVLFRQNHFIKLIQILNETRILHG